MGKRIRGFLLKHRVTTIFRCFFRQHRSSNGYRRLIETQHSWGIKPMSLIFRWSQKLRKRAKSLVYGSRRVTGSGYMEIGNDDPYPMGKKKEEFGVPKGQMAVYVGQKDGDFQRVLVPVIYFNHPLFGELLRGAEEEFGFNHPGAITIPCRISEFEHVQTRIKQGRAITRKLLTWK